MTAIEWTDETWNPTRGCSRVSAGCQHCYAEVQAARIVRMGRGKPTPYDGLVKLVGDEPAWTGRVAFDPERLSLPLRWRTPRRIFVDSMSDLFHESLSNEQIAAVFGVMAAAPQHTFQLLTKRARRMREWFAWVGDGGDTKALRRCGDAAQEAGARVYDRTGPAYVDGNVNQTRSPWNNSLCRWPLPNVWSGVSTENQAAADERIPDLLATPAALRWLSMEPLLGPVDLTHRAPNRALVGATARHVFRATGGRDESTIPRHLTPPPSIDWVVAGCESGPGARHCSVAWLRSLRDQCKAAGVPFFLKQAVSDNDTGPGSSFVPAIAAGPGSHRKPGGVIGLPYLDGVQHKEFPR